MLARKRHLGKLLSVKKEDKQIVTRWSNILTKVYYHHLHEDAKKVVDDFLKESEKEYNEV